MPFAFIFPGQGSQSVGMLAALAEAYPEVQATIATASAVLGYDLWTLVQNGPQEELNRTDKTQPAMLAAGVAVWRVWQRRGGAQPAHMAGHSLGEYTALVCAGALALEQAVAAVAARLEQHGVAALDAAVAYRDVESERDRRRRGVAVFGHRHHHPRHRQIHFLGGGFDDAVVGLVRLQPVDLRLQHIVGAQGLVDQSAQGIDRHFEYFAPFHVNEGLAGEQLIVAARYTGRHGQQTLVTAVGVDVGGEDAGLVARGQHHRAGAVAEQHAGAAVGPVEDARQGLRPAPQHVARAAGADDFVGVIERVHETGADRLNIVGRAALHAETLLQQTRGAGENLIRGGGSDDDEIELLRGDARGFDGATRGGFGEIASGLFRRGDVTFSDAGAFAYPCVSGGDHLFEFGVCQHFLGQIAAGAYDF